MLRESWASCGISDTTDTGARAEMDHATDLLVQDWCDEKVRLRSNVGKSFDGFGIQLNL